MYIMYNCSFLYNSKQINPTLWVGINSQPVDSVLFFFIFQALKFLHEKGIPYGKYCQQGYFFY